MITTRLFLIAFTFLLCCCSNKELTTEEMTNIVKERNDKLGNYFTAGNSDSLATMYTREARLSLNGVDFVAGRQAIENFWKEDMKSTITNKMRTETLTVRGVKDVIYETGRTYLNITYGDSTFNLTVKYCNIWRLQSNGRYLLDLDMANRDAK